MRAPHSSGVASVVIRASFFLLFATSLWAQNTIHVPADQSTIQAAIDVAQNGDTVLVAPGTYLENINFNGKLITVTSSGGASVTVIDGRGLDTVVTFNHGEAANSTLNGFTIRNGRGGIDAGGIQISSSSPTITGNVITDNAGVTGIGINIDGGSPTIRGNTITRNHSRPLTSNGSGGGGISSAGDSTSPASPLIVGNTISNNSIAGSGGGISVGYFGNPTIQDNFIEGNTAFNGGGGIAIQGYDHVVVRQNVILNNTSQAGGSGGGISALIPFEASAEISGNTVADNQSSDGTSGIFITGFAASLTVTNNVVRAAAGQTGVTCDSVFSGDSAIFSNNLVYSPSGQHFSGICNISSAAGNKMEDPQFVAADTGDYHVQPGSPAVDAGSGSAPNIPNEDIEGHTRIADGNGDCTNTIDMGAYELQPAVPQASLSQSLLTFGEWGVGEQSIPMVVDVNNVGQSCVQPTSFDIIGDFVQQNTCFQGLHTGQSCQVFVTFAPTESGLRTGTLSVGGDFEHSPLTAELSGTGVRAVPVFAPDALSFPSVPVGSNSPAQTIILSNTGAVELHIAEVQVTGDFAATDSCSGFLSPGASCGIHVTFKPTARGMRTGTLTLVSNAPAPVVNLTGTGAAPIAVMSPASLSFGNQKVGTTSDFQNVTLTNDGDASLHISNISTSGDFTYVEGCFGGVSVGGSCTIRVRFTPSSAGPHNGTLTIASDSFGTSPTVGLSGVGALPAMELSPSSLSFGVVRVGRSSAAQTITLTNSGNATLQISDIFVAGNEFTQTNGCGAELAAGSSCAINVTYHPTAIGPGLSNLVVSTSDPLSPAFVTAELQGTGGIGVASVSRPTLQFADQLVSTASASQPIILTNVGNAELHVSSITASGDFTASGACSVLAAGASCTINVVFTPTATGARTGSLTINSDSAQPSPVVSLSGTGLTGTPTFSPPSLSFGNQKVGRGSAPQTITLTANGPGPLTIVSIAASEDFGTGNDCPASLSAGSSCTITLVFVPIASGPRSGFVAVHTNAVGSPHIVPLTGTGKGGGKPN